MLASYNLQSTFSGYSFYNAESTPWVIGAILAVLVGYCVMGGGKRIIKFTSTLVPFMGGLYVLVSLVVLVMNIGNLPYVFGLTKSFSELEPDVDDARKLLRSTIISAVNKIYLDCVFTDLRQEQALWPDILPDLA